MEKKLIIIFLSYLVQLLNFFKVIQSLIDKDILPILGSTVYENPLEETLCAGVIGKPEFEDIYNRLTQCLNDKKKQEELAHKVGMDSAWFMKNFSILYKMFGDAIKLGEGLDYAVMGLFE